MRYLKEYLIIGDALTSKIISRTNTIGAAYKYFFFWVQAYWHFLAAISIVQEYIASEFTYS